MNYHNITTDDMNNGSGLRVVLWVSGCNHYCEKCHNPVTWDANGGLPFDNNAKHELFEYLDKDYISGLTLSGGDPMYPGNRDDIYELLKEFRFRYKNRKNVWLYTGSKFEDICDSPIVKLCDVIVDGEFKYELADVNYHWAGSTNQRVINVIHEGVN